MWEKEKTSSFQLQRCTTCTIFVVGTVPADLVNKNHPNSWKGSIRWYINTINTNLSSFKKFISRFGKCSVKIFLAPHAFFIRAGKFCLRLAVLNFFIFEAEMFLICSYFPDWTLQCHKECQTEYNKNTIFHFFHYFSFKQRT